MVDSAQTVSMAHNQSAVSLNCLCPAPPPASSLVPSRRHQPQHQVVTSVKRSSSVDLSALVIASVVNVRLQPASQRDGAAHVRSGRAHDEREGNSKRERERERERESREEAHTHTLLCTVQKSSIER
jgi:hypothetical protein